VGEVHPEWKHIHFTPHDLQDREPDLDSPARMALRNRIERVFSISLNEKKPLSLTSSPMNRCRQSSRRAAAWPWCREAGNQRLVRETGSGGAYLHQCSRDR
jgi:hypothetical protein